MTIYHYYAVCGDLQYILLKLVTVRRQLVRRRKVWGVVHFWAATSGADSASNFTISASFRNGAIRGSSLNALRITCLAAGPSAASFINVSALLRSPRKRFCAIG